MAGADSTIRVNIIGDAKSLTAAADTAGASVKGLGSTAVKAGAVVAGAFATDALLDFGRTALGEFDRLGDASTRLEDQLGDLSGPLIDAADQFAHLGASAQDMLELEARLVDIATAAGVADAELAPLSQSAAATASGLALITDVDAATWLDLIGKAGGGASKPLKELGIELTATEVEARALADTGKDTAESLTEGELAAARLELIMEKLAPRLSDVNAGMGDTEQSTAEVQAKFETLTGKIGGALEGPLNDLLTWILHGIEGWELLAHWIEANEQNIRNAFAPFARFRDLLEDIVRIIDSLPGWAIDVLQGGGGADVFRRGLSGGSTQGGTRTGGGSSGGNTYNLNVNGGSPETIEQAVRDAINHAQGHGPLEFG